MHHCEYIPNHPDADTKDDRPEGVVLTSVRNVGEPEECPSQSNVRLCEECADEFGVSV